MLRRLSLGRRGFGEEVVAYLALRAWAARACRRSARRCHRRPRAAPDSRSRPAAGRPPRWQHNKPVLNENIGKWQQNKPVLNENIGKAIQQTSFE